jgi:hypothetical protein
MFLFFLIIKTFPQTFSLMFFLFSSISHLKLPQVLTMESGFMFRDGVTATNLTLMKIIKTQSQSTEWNYEMSKHKIVN